MSATKKVYCHICPLKEVCPHSQPAASYAVNNYLMYGKNNPNEHIWSLVDIATNNCPLRKLIA